MRVFTLASSMSLHYAFFCAEIFGPIVLQTVVLTDP